MVYEYANRMSKDDYEITILIDCKKIERKYRIIPKKLKYAVCKYYVCKTKKWYNLQHKVSLKCILGINDDTVPDGDIVWATAIDTVKGVYLLSQNKGKKCILYRVTRLGEIGRKSRLMQHITWE